MSNQLSKYNLFFFYSLETATLYAQVPVDVDYDVTVNDMTPKMCKSLLSKILINMPTSIDYDNLTLEETLDYLGEEAGLSFDSIAVIDVDDIPFIKRIANLCSDMMYDDSSCYNTCRLFHEAVLKEKAFKILSI